MFCYYLLGRFEIQHFNLKETPFDKVQGKFYTFTIFIMKSIKLELTTLQECLSRTSRRRTVRLTKPHVLK